MPSTDNARTKPSQSPSKSCSMGQFGNTGPLPVAWARNSFMIDPEPPQGTPLFKCRPWANASIG